MQRWLVFTYGVVSYAIFFATFLYAIGFIGGFAVPTTLDGAPRLPFGWALAVDLGLLGLFAVQHSGMARPGFKRWLTRYLPKPAERSTYVLMSSAAMIAMFWLWQPLGGTIWQVENPLGRALLYGMYGFGWMLVLASTFLINHFDLFGLRQVWLHLRGVPYTPLRFTQPGPYRLVRHPLYVGWLFAFWCTPTMTLTHLLFAIVTTVYILGAIQLEERDLMQVHPEYASYREKTPMLVPALRRSRAARGGLRADA